MLYITHRVHPSGKTDNKLIVNNKELLKKIVEMMPDFENKKEVLEQIELGNATIEIHSRGY